MTTVLWTRADLVAASGGRIYDADRDGPGRSSPGEAGGGISGISIDTRTLQPGELFVALKDQRDGHEFVEAAFRKGAAAALVAESYSRRPDDGELIRVADPLAALGRIGRAARARLAADARVLAVTGSVGKTTTKEMLRACCGHLGATHASEKSYNNHWGVPLTLARMPAGTRFAIFEIGMNHAGEITPLTKMVRPHVAVVTTVEAAHLEHFGSEEAIADAKAEIFLGLDAGGTAVLNADNRHFGRLAAAAARQPGVSMARFSSVRSGEEASTHPAAAPMVWLAQVHAFGQQSLVHAGSSRGAVGYHYTLGAVGAHMIMNSLAVLAALEAAGADVHGALAGLAAFGPPAGRGSRSDVQVAAGRVLLIDESYNANPASMRAALDALATVSRETNPRRVVVLGDMLELGADAPRLHVSLKDAIDAAGVDLVFAAGPNMRGLFDAVPRGQRGAWAETAAGLGPLLLAALRDGDVVMIKGSNGSRISTLVDLIRGGSQKVAGPAAEPLT